MSMNFQEALSSGWTLNGSAWARYHVRQYLKPQRGSCPIVYCMPVMAGALDYVRGTLEVQE